MACVPFHRQLLERRHSPRRGLRLQGGRAQEVQRAQGDGSIDRVARGWRRWRSMLAFFSSCCCVSYHRFVACFFSLSLNGTVALSVWGFRRCAGLPFPPTRLFVCMSLLGAAERCYFCSRLRCCSADPSPGMCFILASGVICVVGVVVRADRVCRCLQNHQHTV